VDTTTKTNLDLIACIATMTLFLIPPAQAADAATGYAAPRTADLFPNQARVDLYATVTAHATWSLQDQQTIDAGTSLTAPLRPASQGTTVRLDYAIKPSCCPQRQLEGTTTLSPPTPLGCQDLSYTKDGWTITLTLCGKLTARPTITGPATTTPSHLDYADWAAADLRVDAASYANDDAAINIQVISSYELTISAKITGWGQTYQSDEYQVHDVQADQVLQAAYTVHAAAPIATTSSTPTVSTPASPMPTISTPPPTQPDQPTAPTTKGLAAAPSLGLVLLGLVLIVLARRP
jgi:hypothetical protein